MARGNKNAIVEEVMAVEGVPQEGEVTLEQAMVEDAALADEEKPEPKAKPIKIRPLDATASYVLTVKGTEYAGKEDKVTNQRPDAEKPGAGKEWYGIAAKRPARRQQVMRVLRDLEAPWTMATAKTAIEEAIKDGRIGKGSENAHTLLGLCYAVAYFEEV